MPQGYRCWRGGGEECRECIEVSASRQPSECPVEEADLLNRIGDVRLSESNVLQGIREAAKVKCLPKRCTSEGKELGIGVNQCGAEGLQSAIPARFRMSSLY